MVTGMIRWPWPTIVLRKFEVRLMVRGIKGLTMAAPAEESPESAGMMIAEVRWKGPKTTALRSLRRSVKRNCTRVEAVKGDQGEVEWNEEFGSVVGLTAHKENAFNPWEIEIVVFYGLKQVSKNKASMIGTASLNIAEYASTSGEELELDVPLLSTSFDADSRPTLHLTLKLLLRSRPELPEAVQRPAVPFPSSPPTGVTLSEKDELSALKAGLRKVKILTEYVSARKSKKTYREDESSDGRCSAGSEEVDYMCPLDLDSLEENPDVELEDGKDDVTIRKSFSYGSLANAKYIDGVFFSDIGKHEDLVYYSHRRSDVGRSHGEEAISSVHEQSILHNKRRILPWKKGKYNFRSPKAKGEPLLKKDYGEEGGDDIDYDRRQLSSSDESLFQLGHKSDGDGSAYNSLVSDFGDDNFAVGTWESKEIISRDGCMKLSVDVFFASIDQRSERAAGQSACTALVAVIAEWFKLNRDTMLLKSQFDGLIREGSLEWRNLCGNQAYIDQFPDKHFDLETVLEAKIRRLSVVPKKSYIGFFHPIGCEGIGGFDFLQGAMSFDSIWEEIARSESDCLYIVSWNDHFFVLKVEQDAYYIIDTLGERLYEGCDRAYILKFDRSTTIHRNKTSSKDGPGGEEGSKQAVAAKEQLVCKGKESCKEYIKSFLAAIPIRELQADMKKGISPSTPLHRHLQIEFHYTEVANDIENFSEFPALPFWESRSQISWPQGSAAVVVV
ncbi:uncharacterized protein LOC110024219 isoform X2 [Phalaenopsis equestris]|uniref:uncharacterized protein LOC110024219 isoform X2 n=1 Tax=Phalaenopsis equestris TaxID=78828 RepID=UPI0009E23565|nr:uncharacterized protein LOC110024219 isoform X2 [Phalaenopsis equestris]